MSIGVQLIFGQYREPFLEAALRSVAWADYVCAVNTDPEGRGAENEAIVRRVVPRERLRLERVRMGKFDFARARNAALALAGQDDLVLIVDADDVHWPEFERACREAEAAGTEALGAHFWHHAAYKDLWHSVPHRKVLFRNGPGVRFVNTMGTVHEEVQGPPTRYETVPGYRYHHYGYVKPAREVARRWEFYRSLGAEIHEYDRTQPDRALDDWPRVCQLYTGEHPPAVREVLGGYPSAPVGLWPRREGPARVGLVMLTWDDAELLPQALRTLEHTTEPHRIVFVDNGSADGTPDLLAAYCEHHPEAEVLEVPGLSLAQALNVGFGSLLEHTDAEYLGWVHPDHRFEWPAWLAGLVREMDAHPEWAKAGATEAGERAELRAGNSQCFIVRRAVLEAAGLFDEAFEACGGYEDWDANARLLKHGYVMITPEAMVRHLGMQTRQRHDNVEAAKRNADLYHTKHGQWEAFV